MQRELVEKVKSTPLKQKWSEAKTKGFIIAYLNRPELWDTNCQSYTQKKEKQKAYNMLMDNYGLTMNEVKNKIRIFRTTYSQERKKEQTIANYIPKLSWFADMKSAFGEGKIKSFNKVKKDYMTHVVKKEDDSTNHQLVQIEYEEEEYDNSDSLRGEELSTEHNTTQEVIVEPYDEDENLSNQITTEISYSSQKSARQTSENFNSTPTTPSNSKQKTLLSSNELFLQSLKSSLDQLSDEKNMRARIKIQEILYQIMYETS